jgi:uncharacterized membrane protein
MSKKISNITIIALIINIIIVVIVYFGRIYYPDKFMPETTSFFENYWVLLFGIGFIFLIGGIIITILYLLGKELYIDIEKTSNKNK